MVAVLRQYHSLELAKRSIFDPARDRIWAGDRIASGGRKTKYFLVLSVGDMYEFLKRSQDRHHFYELISEDQPVHFHLDVEIETCEVSDQSNMRKLLVYLDIPQESHVSNFTIRIQLDWVV